MMWSLFKTALYMSMGATLVSLVIIPIKAILQKLSFPRKYLMLLWLVIVFRLVCPYVPKTDAGLPVMRDNQNLSSSVSADITDNKIRVTAKVTAPPRIYAKISDGESASMIYRNNTICTIWIVGIFAIQIYNICKKRKLKSHIRFSTKFADNIYESDGISTSFVVGFFKPKIYIPAHITDSDRQNMIIHEKTHIRCMHHKIKFLFYAVLTVHWFNPIVWILYRLLSADMEYACDEISIGSAHKKSYINTIFNISKGYSRAAAPPDVCTFSSLSKKRIAHLAKIHKQSKLYAVPVIAIFIAASFLLCTDAKVKTTPANADFALPFTSKPLEAAFLKPDDSGVAKDPLVNQVTESKENTSTQEPSLHPPEAMSGNDLSTYKANEKSEMPYEGFWHLEPEGITCDNLCNELESNNLTQGTENADLSQNYIKDSYTSTPDGVCIPSVMCDQNGNISLYISLNTDSLFEVNIHDSETGNNVYGCMILANGKNAYSFMGFEQGKKYDINMKETTGGQWKTEGTYIIY